MGRTGTPAVVSQVALADEQRRASVLRWITTPLVALTALALLVMGALGAPSGTTAATAVALVAFVAALGLARSDGRRGIAATLLLGAMLVQHLWSSLGLTAISEAASVVCFTGICPFIALATLGLRGTLVTCAASLGVVGLATWGALHAGGDPAVISRAFWPPAICMLFSSTVAITSAVAAQRSLRRAIDEERHRTAVETAARRAEERFRLVTDHVSDLVALLSEDGRYTFVSASHERLLGLAPSALIGRLTPELVHPEDLPALSEAFARALRDGAGDQVARIRAKDGTYRTFHLRLARVDEDGAAQIALAGRDITELHALSAQLEGARRMESLGRLAGGVAHDFNNLLAVVESSASLAEQMLAPTDPAREDLDAIHDAVRRASELTGQLLAFARQQTLARAFAVPGAVVKKLAPLLTRTVGAGVSLTIEAADDTSATAASETQIEQLVVNLVMNARDALPDRTGRVCVGVEPVQVQDAEVAGVAAGSYVRLEVRDDGMGMSAAVRARVFEPFFTTKGPGRGTGLGLATCFGIATQLGGTITVDSTEGAGSTFRVYLPCVEAPATGASPERVTTPPSTAMRVLVLEQDAVLRGVVGRVLTARGHAHALVSTPEEALSAAQREPFDVLVLDAAQGRLETLEVLRRAQPKAGIVMTAGFLRGDAALETGDGRAVTVLPKPFAPDRLLAALADARRPTR